MKRQNTFIRDNLLVEELIQHRGRENAMSTKQIMEFLGNNGYPYKANGIGKLVNRISKERCLPICYENGKGYYWPLRRSEIQTTVRDLQGRIDALQEHIDRLRNFIIE